MKAPLTKFIITSLISIGLNQYAYATWSVSRHSPLDEIPATSKNNHTRSHFVQIFSSINATKAEGMKNTLEMQGYRAFVKIGKKQPHTFYQVQIGPFGSKQSAQNAKMSIIQLYPQFHFLNDAIIR